MKHIIHTPTADFAYVETEIDDLTQPLANEVLSSHEALVFKVMNKGGLADDVWRDILDDLLDDQSIKGDPGCIELMSPAQRYVVNEIKKSFKRLNK